MDLAFSAVFWGIVTFSLLVVLHEGGHFVAARLAGVKVHEFMIGLPGPAVRLHGKNTTYGITAIPLGGYVRIAGMEPGAEDPLLARALKSAAVAGVTTAERLAADLGVAPDRAEALLVTLDDWGAVKSSRDHTEYTSLVEAAPEDDADALLDGVRRHTYRGLKTWQRVSVLAMGVIVNLLAAILTFTVVLSVWGYYQPTTTIDSISKGSAAEKAGLKVGDELVAVDGKDVVEWQTVISTIGSHEPGDTMKVAYERGGEKETVTVVLGERKAHGEQGTPFLGVGTKVEHVQPNVIEALRDSFKWTGMVFVAIGDFFRPSTFSRSVEGARSVVGISVEVARAAKSGPLDYAFMVALLSLSLGAMNILPIPPLDGGKIVIELVERALGRPLRREVSLGFSAVGALLLFALIGYLMYADVVRYVVNG